ncbi:hypothetical protein IWW48_005535 [Coemansia sp. RSA 1200]|nr:hypothetical protein IWW48_005535 [Coemansia sp. RSA 1200]
MTEQQKMNTDLPDPSSFQILETTLYTHEYGLLLLDQHLDRMRRSALTLSEKCYPNHRCFPVAGVSPAVVESRLQRALTNNQQQPNGCQKGRARILLSSDGALDVQVVPIPTTSEDTNTHLTRKPPPPLLVLDPQPTEGLRASPFVACKTTFRRIYDAAAARALAGSNYPDGSLVLLHNTAGRVTEAHIANVAVSKLVDGTMRLVTPPVSDGLLAGTMRAHLLKSGQIVEGPVAVDDFRNAVANAWRVVCMNSVRGMFDVTPVALAP